MSADKIEIEANKKKILLESHLNTIALSLRALAAENPVESWDCRDVPIDNRGNFVEQYSAQLGPQYRAQIWRPGLRGEAHHWVLQIVEDGGAEVATQTSRSLGYLMSIARHLLTDVFVDELRDIYGVGHE